MRGTDAAADAMDLRLNELSVRELDTSRLHQEDRSTLESACVVRMTKAVILGDSKTRSP